jgi:hypothetical protein
VNRESSAQNFYRRFIRTNSFFRRYDEELTFGAMGAKPILSVSQKTFKPQTQIGMHFESGYLRFPPNGRCG